MATVRDPKSATQVGDVRLRHTRPEGRQAPGPSVPTSHSGEGLRRRFVTDPIPLHP